MHPAKERIAAVFGRAQGSGYLLTPNLVLTAAHVIGDCDTPRAVVPGGTGPVRCRTVWARDDSRRCDAALLVAERDLVDVETAAAFEPLVWGRAYDLRAWPGAQAVGFPQVQRDGDDELDTEQIVGTFKPGSNLIGGRHVLDSEHAAPEEPGGGGSPWAGMSGSAVFVDGLLAGVVCADPGGWRHGRLTVTPSATLWSHFRFLSECLMAGHKPESRSLTSHRQLEVEVFEQRLRDYLVEKAGALTIIGLTLSDGEGETWPLDAAYLSLELVGAGGPADGQGFEPPTGDPAGPARSVPAPQRAEEALAGQRRVLLRGAAGSGKTTLLQWLATVTARGDLPPGLGHLSGCMPLTLPLRTLIRQGELPQPEEFLAAAARPLAGLPAAQGWVTRRLAEGTALILIDGVDEVPEADRRRTLSWLKDLLAAYPDARYVLTTRPSAVREGWLSDAGFTELELQPMSRADVADFIDRWHTAAGQAHDERLRAFRDSLTAAVVTKRDLGRLATNPLMCALICALNRSRRGYLPHGRMELYRAALELLLIRRDRERDIVVGLEGPELEQAQTALLQKIAYWLIRNGRSEIEWDRAVEILDRALPAMPAVAARGSAEEILRHLVLRSGLLRQPTSETLDFIHRTFQDYLGAQAAVDDWDFDLLVNHAHDDQWEDVLRMAVGHAPPRARAELLRKLLERGEREEPNRYRLHLLAAACLEQATEVDADVRTRVEKAAAELVPPRDQEAAKALAAAGQVVLDLLPGPEGLDDVVAHAVVVAATVVADDRAIPLLARYATHPSVRVRAQLAWSWDRFDTEHYAEAVVGALPWAGEDFEQLQFVAKTAEQLRVLKRWGGRPRIQLNGPLAAAGPADLATPALVDLSLQQCPEVVDLRTLGHCAPLHGLWIGATKGISHLAELDSSALRTFHVSLDECPEGLDVLADMPELTSLRLHWPERGHQRWQTLSLPPGLTRLDLGPGLCAALWSAGVRGHHRLETVAFHAVPDSVLRRQLALDALDELRALEVTAEHPDLLDEAPPLPQVERVTLTDPVRLPDPSQLFRAYPRLKTLFLRVTTSDPVDLAVFRELGHALKLDVVHRGPLLNQDQLPESVELTAQPWITF
ncbi:signal transduction protein [Streptomyces albireticuli]|uniref:Signal transduction protein n=1 Tax=Streptomyces albireticuli TaxID=1940 RepID=A0A1Z2L5F9_9ACTN|nr:serine protease [Streptomyces albireticuli]ARZ69498.1 signal transduction protein [Streptomyces albireticuli]